jgi:hypothetical protein
MNLRHLTLLGSLSALAVGGALLAPTRAYAQETGYEELTRGPVHEAFAGAVSFDPEPSLLVRTAPPEDIEEIPPDQELEGDNVAWIPGYWGWEEDQNDFIWISGIWRNLPPGRQWVPGYWSAADDQWQWTSGYWADEEAEEVTYLPEPPKSIETGPNVAAPSEDHIWISGTWVNREERYGWRPGYWERGQQDWAWSPAHYRWTPYGYVFIDGYWDYNVARRGVVFAPVRIQRSYYTRPNYSYTPAMVISLNVFSSHLFVRPNYGHYYFGDYYAPRYRTVGFYDSHSYHSGRRGYDSIYAHDRWRNRSDRDWERSRRDNYNFYRDNEDARPPRTWAALSSRPEGSRRGQRDDYEFAQPLSRYAERRESGQRFQKVTAEKRSKLVEQRKDVRKFSEERKRVESRAKAETDPEKRNKVKREKFVKSPLVAKRAEQLSGKDAPPKRRATRDADLQDAKTAGRNGDDGKKPEAIKKGDKKTTDEKRGATEQPEKGKGKSAEQERGKSGDKATDEKRGATEQPEKGKGKTAEQERGKKSEPAPKAATSLSKKGDSEPKDAKRNDVRPAPKPETEKGRKEVPPSRKPEQVKPQKKQAERPETPRKPEPRVTPKPAPRPEPKPQRQAAPVPEKAKQPEKEKAKRSPEPIRSQAPARQVSRENKPSAQPVKRQPEPKRVSAPPAKRQVAEAPRKAPQAAKQRVAEAPRKAPQVAKQRVAEAPRQSRESDRSSTQKKGSSEEERGNKKKKD